MVNAKPRLNPYQRELACHRVRSEGWTVIAAASAAGVSRQTVHKWIRRLEGEGPDGLRDRSSRPHRMPRLTRIDPAVRIAGSGWRAGWARTNLRVSTEALRGHQVPFRVRRTRGNRSGRPAGAPAAPGTTAIAGCADKSQHLGLESNVLELPVRCRRRAVLPQEGRGAVLRVRGSVTPAQPAPPAPP